MSVQIGGKMFTVAIDTSASLRERVTRSRLWIDPDFWNFEGAFDGAVGKTPGGIVVRCFYFARIDRPTQQRLIKRAIARKGFYLADVDDQIALTTERPQEQAAGPIVQLASTANHPLPPWGIYGSDVSILDVENKRNVITTADSDDRRIWKPKFNGKPYRFLIRVWND